MSRAPLADAFLPRRLTEPRPSQRRVALLSDDFFPESGGVSRVVSALADELIERGDHVTIIAPPVQFDPPVRADYLTVPTLRVPGTPSYACSLAMGERTARKVAAARTFDVVHSHNERGSLPLAARLAVLMDAPHVHTFHSNYAGVHASSPIAAGACSVGFLPAAVEALARATRRRRPPLRLPRGDLVVERDRFAARDWGHLAQIACLVDGFTSPAAFVIKTIEDAAAESVGRGFAVAAGVSPVFAQARRRRPVDAPLRFISAGRLGAEKRVDAIIEAFGRLGDPDAELLIVGEGVEAEPLRRCAARVGGRITFAGHLGDPARLAAELADADVFVLASHRFDTQALVLAEAACAGLPLLLCDDRLSVGVTDSNALVTEPDVDALAAGMRVLGSDPARRRRMADASRAVAPTLAPRAMGQAYSDAYDEIAQGRRRVRP